MKYELIQNLKSEHFRRLTGVKPITFKRMIEILKEANVIKKASGGRKNKLSIEDQLLLSLEYLREYRTYFHMGKSYGISESAAFKSVKWIENILIKHPDFALLGKKALVKNFSKDDVILIDVTESPIERPKKNKNNFIPVRKRNIR
jgi:hypothetical protein